MPTNKLTDSKIRSFKPDAKRYKRADGEGLSIIVEPTGSKLWEFAYRFERKQKNIRFGKYPTVTLAAARARRDEAKALLASGLDPSAQRKQDRVSGKTEPKHTWRTVAYEWLDREKISGRKPATQTKQRWLLEHTFETLGDRPIADLSLQDFWAELQKIESAGKYETAKRTRAICEQVCAFAKRTGILRENPVLELRGQLISPKSQHHAALTDPKAVGGLMRAIRGYEGAGPTRNGLLLLAYTFLRSGEIRHLEWSHVNWKAERLIVPGALMKMGDDHVVPLSTQALDVLEHLHIFTGRQKYVLASAHKKGRPLSENTFNNALRTMGFSKHQMTAHGFRRTASTLLNEMGFTDPAGNGNTASNTVTAEANLSLPTATIGALAGPLSGPFTAPITLSGDSTDFTVGSLEVDNATATLSGSGATYTATLTPLRDGSVRLSVPARAFTVGGLPNTASNTVTAATDVDRPEIVITPLIGAPNGPQQAQIILSEPTTPLSPGQLNATNATVTLSGSDTFYIATLTPVADGTVSLSVPANVVEDPAGNLNNASNTVSTVVDVTPPTITISPLTGPSNGDQTATITLSEPSTDFTLADLTLGNATATLSGSGTSYTAVLTPLGDGTVSLSVDAGTFTDASGNLNTASNRVTADVIVSTLEVSFIIRNADGVVSNEAFAIPATFFPTDTTISSAPIVSWSWRFEAPGAIVTSTLQNPPFITLRRFGTYTVTLTVCTATRCERATGEPIVVRDPDLPTVTLSGLNGSPIAGPQTITAFFDQGVSTSFGPALSLDLFDVTGATLSDLSGPPPLGNNFASQTYTFLLTPTGSDISLSLAADAVRNANDTPYPASAVLTALFDNVPPTVVIGDLIRQPNGVFTAAITLSEPSSDFSVDSLTTTNATAVLTGSGPDYIATLTPLADGEVTLVVEADSFTDASGNLNLASNTVAAISDQTAPTLTLADAVVQSNGTYTVAITLSEPDTDFNVDDLTVTNATATLSGSGTSYLATLTPQAEGEVTIFVAAGAFMDATGNENTASNLVRFAADLTGPTVLLETTATGFSGLSDITITAQFSEPVVGFETADISVANGRVQSLSGSGTAFTFTVAASGTGDLVVSLPAGAVDDAAGNPSAASNVLRIADSTVQDTQLQIARFMQSRANLLLSNQPNLTGFLSNAPARSFNVAAKAGTASFDLSLDQSGGQPFWLRANGNWSDEGTRNNRYVFAALGRHVALSDTLLVGAMLQYDDLSSTDGPARISGRGWLIGPYVVAKSRQHPLYFEGQLLWGRTSNRISPFGTYTDDFDTERVLARLKLQGDVIHGKTRVMPSLAMSYTSDSQESYRDSLGNLIPEQGIELGQIELGLAFETPLTLPTGQNVLMLTGGLTGIGSFTSGSGFASTVIPEFEGGRARIDLGLDYRTPNGITVQFSSFYDGIGASGFRNLGAEIQFEWRF